MSDSDDANIQSSLQTTRHRDVEDIRRRMDSWLGAHGGGRVASITAPTASGASSELFLIDLQDAPIAGDGLRRTVMRLIGEHAVYPHVDQERQFICQRLMAERSPAPAPRALACELDAAAIGAPFIMMDRADGRGAPDWPSYVREGWIRDLDDDSRFTLWINAIRAIAEAHATDLTDVDVQRLYLPGGGADGVARLVDYWKLYLSVVREQGDYPALEASLAYLEREKPQSPNPERLVWGDASLRNMLFDGLQPVALLDLEFAHVGPPEFDIAFFAMMDRVMAEGYAGLPRLTGFCNEARTYEEYERASGLTFGHRDYFQRMAVTYMSLANTRVYQRLAAEGRMDWADVGRNPPLRFLAQMFDLDPDAH